MRGGRCQHGEHGDSAVCGIHMQACNPAMSLQTPWRPSSFPCHRPSAVRQASPQGAAPAPAVRASCASRASPHPCAAERVVHLLPPASPPPSPTPRASGNPARPDRSGGPPKAPCSGPQASAPPSATVHQGRFARELTAALPSAQRRRRPHLPQELGECPRFPGQHTPRLALRGEKRRRPADFCKRLVCFTNCLDFLQRTNDERSALEKSDPILQNSFWDFRPS